MLNEELLEVIIRYKRNTGKNPDVLKLNPTYFRRIELSKVDY